MTEPDRSSERYRESIEEVPCPACGKGRIRVSFVAGYMSWNVSRISAGARRTRYYHDPKVRVHESCPACGARKAEIREILERGGKRVSHEERMRRLRESGLPSRIETTEQKAL